MEHSKGSQSYFLSDFIGAIDMLRWINSRASLKHDSMTGDEIDTTSTWLALSKAMGTYNAHTYRFLCCGYKFLYERQIRFIMEIHRDFQYLIYSRRFQSGGKLEIAWTIITTSYFLRPFRPQFHESPQVSRYIWIIIIMISFPMAEWAGHDLAHFLRLHQMGSVGHCRGI